MKRNIIIFLVLTIFIFTFMEACMNPFFPVLGNNPGKSVGGTGGDENNITDGMGETGNPVTGPFGTIAWINTLEGPEGVLDLHAQFKKVAADQNGNVYVLGTQFNNYDYVYGSLAATGIMGPAGTTYTVLIKYSADGNAQWAKTVWQDSPNLRYAAAFTVDGQGNIYSAGNFNGINSALVKYDTNGNLIWKSEDSDSIGYIIFNAAAADSKGNVFVIGKNTVDYNYNPVLVKYDSEGKFQWMHIVSEKPDYNQDNSIAADSENNIYVTAKDESNNSVLIKYDNDGDPIWTKTVTGYTAFVQIAVDGENNIYITGNQAGTGSYDYGNGITIEGAGDGLNPILVKYDSNGNCRWARTTEEPEPAGMGYAAFHAVTADRAGYVYAAGTQWGICNYGNGVTVTGPDYYYQGEKASSLLVKYDAESGNAKDAWIVNKGSDESQFWDIAADPSSGYLYAAGFQYDDGDFDYGSGKIIKGICSENPILAKFYK
ncbi:MAG: hypothetical protein FWD78_00150 [Treponema sp.]|nr:hypothetical protein [Treponema sp.]